MGWGGVTMQAMQLPSAMRSCHPCRPVVAAGPHLAPSAAAAASGWSLAGQVQTVLGPLPPSELGQVMAHEHLLVDLTWARDPQTASDKLFFEQPLSIEVCGCCRTTDRSNRADLLLGSVDEAVEEMVKFKMAGGGTIIEPTAIGIGRDPLGLQQISRGSGVHIVMGAAFYVATVHPAAMDEWSVDQIAEMLIEDIVSGASIEEASPSSGVAAAHRTSTGVRAGIIGEIGCSWPLHPNEVKVLQAAAVAQRATGAAITIHPGRDEYAPIETLRAPIPQLAGYSSS